MVSLVLLYALYEHDINVYGHVCMVKESNERIFNYLLIDLDLHHVKSHQQFRFQCSFLAVKASLC